MEELKIKIKAKFTKESEFTTFWLKELKELWFACDKISDWSIWTKKIDCYITSDKAMYVCEVKIIEWKTFNLWRIRDNQRAYLSQVNKLWWKAIMCVASKKLQEYVIFSFDRIKDFDRKTTSLDLKF